MTLYSNNLAHLQDEFRCLDLLLQRAVQQFRLQRSRDKPEEFRGWHISDAEVDALMTNAAQSGNQVDVTLSDVAKPGILSSSEGNVTQNKADEFADDALRKDLAGDQNDVAALRHEIQQRLIASQRTGVFLRLPHLSAVFGLTSFETDLLLLALAPELDLRYQKLYAYLQDDVTRKRPSVDLALRLLGMRLDQHLKAREAFAENSPLFAYSLLTLHEDPAERPLPLLSRSLKMDDRIAEFLLGSDRMDQRLTAGLQMARWMASQFELRDLIMPEKVKASLEKMISIAAIGAPWLCLLQGPAGAGKKTAAEAVCRAMGRSLLVLEVATLLKSESPFQTLLRVALREARLYGSAIYLDGWQELLKDEPRHQTAVQVVQQEVERMPGLVFLGSRSPWQPASATRCNFVSLALPQPTDRERRILWATHLRNGHPVDPTVNPDHLAGTFRFTPGQIRQAITHAGTHALLRQGEDHQLTMADLLAGCRTESTRHLVAFAKKITPKRVWGDLVLPKDTSAQLREFCQQVRYRMKVYGDWGFDQRLSLGKGQIALFTGPSGTGKTLSAEIMANELGLDLYKVDLSSVVSKYIGETEKNLSRVFQDAQESNAILFFDEADALFGKRSEVKDAHDRYANIEINYLLQQVEEYEGVVILASNMKKNIDEAFLRRLHFSIEFPFPDEDHRRRIWRGIFPAQAPLENNLDFDFLARKFKLAGGNIKNVALSAAFRAAEDGGVIRMDHLILAMKREYQKLGKVCEKTEFEKYYDLVR